MCDDLFYHTALGPYPMEGGVVDRPRDLEPVVTGQQVSNVEAAQAWARSPEAKEAIRTAHEAVSEMMRHLQAERRIDPDDLRVPMMTTDKLPPDTPHYDADDEARQTDRNTLGNVIQRVTGKDRESMKREVWRVDQVISTGDMLGKLVDGKPRDERKAVYDAAVDVLHKRIVGEK